MKIQEIKAAYQALDPDDEPMLQQFIHTYGTDARSGVQTLVEQTKKKLVQLEAEYVRSEKMLAFERKYHAMGSRYICGIDEVGRGPLAGPVVACAVILPEDEMLLHLNDSKQVSASRRDELFDEIQEKAIASAVGIVSPQRIDEINILQATYEAMHQAVERLKVTPDLLLVDAVTIPAMPMKQVGIIKGDAKSVSIAAASILAKVTRDRMMVEYDALYPEYGFAKHKGYGSQMHIEAIREYGSCPIHRRTFIKNFY